MANCKTSSRFLIVRSLLAILLLHLTTPVLGRPRHHGHHHRHPERSIDPATTCRNEAYQYVCLTSVARSRLADSDHSPFDYSVKPRQDPNAPLCPIQPDALAVVETRDLLMGRQVTQEQDYSCGPDRPCRNGSFHPTRRPIRPVAGLIMMLIPGTTRGLLSQGDGVVQLRPRCLRHQWTVAQ